MNTFNTKCGCDVEIMSSSLCLFAFFSSVSISFLLWIKFSIRIPKLLVFQEKENKNKFFFNLASIKRTQNAACIVIHKNFDIAIFVIIVLIVTIIKGNPKKKNHLNSIRPK